MIRFLLRSFLLLQALALELWMLSRTGGATPDASAILIAFCVFDLAPARVPYLLLPLALGRGVLHPGSVAFQLWAVLSVYVVTLPLRRVLFRERWQLQMVVGFTLAVGLSLLQAKLLSAGGGDPLGRTIPGFLLTGIVTPGALLVLGFCYRGVATPRQRAGPDVAAVA